MHWKVDVEHCVYLQRRPVWQEDAEEARTPRKGAHMFASTGSPAKGRPMFRYYKECFTRFLLHSLGPV